jgi:hypothetical protein
MVFPVVGGREEQGYNIENSLRFNPGDNAFLNRTPGSEGNKRTYTLSFWAKITAPYRSDTSTNNFFTARNSDGMTSGIQQISGGHIQSFIYDDTGGEGYKLKLTTSAAYYDPAAWYHFVLAVDTTQGSASNRAKFYVNGSQVTSFSTATYPDQNFDSHINDDVPHYMGNKDGSADDYDGYLADFYLIDGTQYAASNFGETDDNGVWIPKKTTGLSFGTNGFFMEFQQTGTSANASGKGADTSGQGNHYDDNNMTAEDITVDTPTNNFATLSPLDTNSNHTFSEGNCKIAYSASAGTFGVTKSTIGVSSGKWYWEIKYTYGNAGQFGVFDVNDTLSNASDIFTEAGNSTFEGLAWRIDSSNNIKEVGEGQTDDTNVDFSSGNILGIAFDADNGKIYAYNNGTELTSQDISAGTSLITALTVSDFFLPFISNGDGGSGTKTGTSEINFGNPTFSISSGNADANGYGNFEYAVPSGYFSLCTKNLAEYG